MTGIETSSCSSPTQSLVDAQTVTTPVAEKQKPVRNVDENTAPLTKDEEKVFTKIARVKLQQSGDNTVRCKTGGQSITLAKTEGQSDFIRGISSYFTLRWVRR